MISTGIRAAADSDDSVAAVMVCGYISVLVFLVNGIGQSSAQAQAQFACCSAGASYDCGAVVADYINADWYDGITFSKENIAT